MTELELRHRPDLGRFEGEHSPFLTDRETAELTALTTLGPLALVAFDTQPQSGLRPSPETAPAVAADPTNETIDGFPVEALLTAMRRQENLSRAAVMFAARELN